VGERVFQTTNAIILAVALSAPTQARPAVSPAVKVSEVWRHEGEVRATLRVEGIFDEQARRNLEQGGVSLLGYQIEVFRKRAGWFDNQIGTEVNIPFRLSFDTFERRFRLQGTDIGVKSESFEEIVNQCTNLSGVTICPLDGLDPDASYYLTVKCAFQPMAMESLEELRAWMGGGESGAQDQGQRQGIGARLAQMLMSAAGLGQKQLQGTSDTFRPRDLIDR
jgi:hypothetical protein